MLEQQGILVPRRFESLAEALEAIKQGKDIVVRSEHPAEYAGASGLLETHLLNAKGIEKGKAFCAEKGEVIDWTNFEKDPNNYDAYREVINKTFGSLDTLDQSAFEENLRRLSQKDVRRYCKLLGLDIDQFSKEISFSYWERIPGFNRSIVADSAVSNRYHIFTTRTNKYDTNDNFFHNHAIIDNGEIVLDNPVRMTDEIKSGIGDVISFYEKVRNTEGFDPNHCPVVEFQTFENQNYFLQYHRTRDSEPSKWKLERGLEEGEFKVAFVRGATPPEGLILNASIYLPGTELKVKDKEEAAFDFQWNLTLSEIMSRRRRVNFSNKSLLDLTLLSIDAHLPKSKMFNPEIFVSIDIDGEGISKDFYSKKSVKLRLVSDGRKAYVKFL